MPCILVLLAILVPRVVLLFIWLQTNWYALAFDGQWVWPILGCIFMPYATLAYMVAVLQGGVQGVWALLLLAAVLVDLSHVTLGRPRPDPTA